MGNEGKMKYVFSEEEIAEIQEARRKNRDKNVDRRLTISQPALGRSPALPFLAAPIFSPYFFLPSGSLKQKIE